MTYAERPKAAVLEAWLRTYQIAGEVLDEWQSEWWAEHDDDSDPQLSDCPDFVLRLSRAVGERVAELRDADPVLAAVLPLTAEQLILWLGGMQADVEQEQLSLRRPRRLGVVDGGADA